MGTPGTEPADNRSLWEKKQLTREMRRMFPRKTGRRVLIMLDELHQFFDSREKP